MAKGTFLARSCVSWLGIALYVNPVSFAEFAITSWNFLLVMAGSAQLKCFKVNVRAGFFFYFHGALLDPFKNGKHLFM